MRKTIFAAIIGAALALALLPLALLAQPYPCTNRAADSTAAWTATTVGVRRPAIVRMLACVDSANKRAARDLFIRDSILARIIAAKPAPVDSPVVVPPPDSTPAVTPPPVPGFPNLPAGLPTLVDFDGGTNLTGMGAIDDRIPIFFDAAAPKSPSAVRRFTLRPSGCNENEQNCSQASTGNVETRSGLNLTEVYIARWLKPSAGMQGARSGSKSMFIRTATSGALYINWMNGRDGGGGPVYMRPIGQGICPVIWYEPNRDGPGMPLGQWSLSEVYFKLNTPGASDGIMRIWTNGQLTHEYTNLNCRSSSSVTVSHIQSDFYQNDGTQVNNPDWSWLMDHKFVAGR